MLDTCTRTTSMVDRVSRDSGVLSQQIVINMHSVCEATAEATSDLEAMCIVAKQREALPKCSRLMNVKQNESC